MTRLAAALLFAALVMSVQAQDATYDPPNVPSDIIAPERPRGTPRQRRVIMPDTTPPIAVLPLDPSPEAETAPQAPAVHRHDLRGHARGDRSAPQGLHPQVAAASSRRRGQPGGSWRPPLRFHSPATHPVAQGEDKKRDRASPRGVQATDQNPDRAAVGRYCCDVVLGAARLRADQHAESRRLADARHTPHRATD